MPGMISPKTYWYDDFFLHFPFWRTKDWAPEILLIKRRPHAGADSICQPCVCSDTYAESGLSIIRRGVTPQILS